MYELNVALCSCGISDVSLVLQGVMSEAIPWKLLQDQYFSDNSYEDEIAKLVHSPEEVCYCCFF